MSQELMSIDDVQRELNVGRTTVYNLLDQGKLKSVKIGRYRRITKESFDAYVEELFESTRT